MKSKGITIKEILKRIIDEKEPPKRIKYITSIYRYNNRLKLYQNEKTNTSLGCEYALDEIFHNVVEIIDEEDGEFEEIKSLRPISLDQFQEVDYYGFYKWKADERTAINQLIRNQKKIIERLEKDDKE